MKRNRIIIFLCAGVFFLPGIIPAQNLTITQIDSAKLLTSSTVDCYVSITDRDGVPLPSVNSSLLRAEHETAQGMAPAEILSMDKNESSNTKITFLLVLDNSGSMYTSHRMEHAVRAVKDFLGSIHNDDVRVGLAVFNTRYNLLAEPGNNMDTVEEALSEIEKPDSKDAYTELYYSIGRAAEDLSKYSGRKAVVLLSDGENYPYFTKSGKLHPDFGKKLYRPENALAPLQKDGVTLYGINFSLRRDKALSSISTASGGTMYSALTAGELSDVYGEIKRRIENEYRLTVAAPLVFLEAPAVTIRYAGMSDTRTYSARSLMGSPADKPVLFSLIVFGLALILWILLLFIRFEKAASAAEISMLPGGAGKPLQRTIVIDSHRTVIGRSPQADFTVAGISEMKENHAEIVRDEKKGTYTIISGESISVNNNLTKKRELKPGDVINVEGATIVFDAPEKSTASR